MTFSEWYLLLKCECDVLMCAILTFTFGFYFKVALKTFFTLIEKVKYQKRRLFNIQVVDEKTIFLHSEHILRIEVCLVTKEPTTADSSSLQQVVLIEVQSGKKTISEC